MAHGWESYIAYGRWSNPSQSHLIKIGGRWDKYLHFAEQRIRDNCRMYKNAFRKAFGDKALPLYASKACAFKQIYRIMAEEGMGADTVSRGEICTALAAGFPAERIWFHGNGKTDADIRYALEHGVGRFVVDGDKP